MVLNVTDELSIILKERLKPIDLPHDLIKQYDVSESIPSLGGALLSRRGVVSIPSEGLTGSIQVCKRCNSSLRRKQEGKEAKPPQFSIANGFAIGELPLHLKGATDVEHYLTSLASISPPIYVVRGGRHRAIRDM